MLLFTPYQTYYSRSKPSPLFKSPAEDFSCLWTWSTKPSESLDQISAYHPSCSKILPLEEAKPLGREVSGKKWKLKLMESKRSPFLKMRVKDRDKEGKHGKIRREFDIEKC